MIEKLKYFVALAEEKHFGRVATVCGVTQPTVSLAIKSLEKELDTQLVRRGQYFIGLTAEGELALEWARRIVADVQAMSQDIKGAKHKLGGRIRMASIPTALPVVAQLTKPLRTLSPGLSFQVVSRPSEGIRRLLDEIGIDAAITYISSHSARRLTSIPLYREEYRLVTSRKFSRARKGNPTWAEVSKLPLGVMDAENEYIMDALKKARKASPEITIASDSVGVLLSHIRTGNLVGILPETILRSSNRQAEFRALPIVEPTISARVGLVMPFQEPMTAVSRALATQARQLARHLARSLRM